MPARDLKPESTPSKIDQLERTESELWRVSLLLLTLVATGLAVASWERLRNLPQDLEALPIGVVVLFVLFAAHAWNKKREISELRGFIRGLQERAEAPPSERQLDQLFEVITKSQRGYRDLIDSLDDLVFSLSLEGEIQAANRCFAGMFEQPFSELIGHRLDEFLDEPNRAAAEKALPRFLERRHWSGSVRARVKKTGAVRYFECALHAIVKDDRIVGVSGLARDITHQRESELRFTELFETLQEGIYFSSPDGKLLDANPALVRMLGYDSKEELLGVNVVDLYYDAAQRPVLLRDLEQHSTVRDREIVLRRKDGTPVICLDSSTASRDAAGRVTRYQGTLVDITQRREMEKRLHEEQEFARRLVDSFPDLIVVLDTQGRYTFISPRIRYLLGYAAQELLGRTLGERSDPSDRAALLELHDDLITGKRSFGTLEYRTQHKDGSWRIFRANASPLFDAEGEITGVIASARDVTEFKRLEQQVIQSEKLAAVGQMIAGVAHELNNPLTAILGVSDLLREQAGESPSWRHLELVHKQARRAADIVQNLLAFSQPAAPTRVPLKLSELVQRSLELHEYALRTNNIAVDFLPQLDLPAVVGDPNQLIQVFLNLITNAQQAIREVRDRGTLRVRLGRTNSNVWVTFQDDGPGIHPDVMPKIFDPFFTTKRPGGGTGLGLSICLAIVKGHGGHIEARPAPGGGAVFTASLPIGRASEVTLEQAAPRTPAVSLQGRSILVVDDEESIRELVYAGLSARGLDVDCVSNGEEALSRAAVRSYDAILCDVKMSGLSGQQVFERFQNQPGGAKHRFIFMTGDLVDPATMKFLRQSGARLVAKPFRIADLVGALGELLEPSTARAN